MLCRSKLPAGLVCQPSRLDRQIPDHWFGVCCPLTMLQCSHAPMLPCSLMKPQWFATCRQATIQSPVMPFHLPVQTSHSSLTDVLCASYLIPHRPCAYHLAQWLAGGRSGTASEAGPLSAVQGKVRVWGMMQRAGGHACNNVLGPRPLQLAEHEHEHDIA